MATKVAGGGASGSASAAGPSSVEVCWEDQQGICEFGRLAARRHELAAALDGKRRAAEDAAEAAGELLALSEEEEEEDSDFGDEEDEGDDKDKSKKKEAKENRGAAVRLLEGECFVHYGREAAEARLEALEKEAAAAEKKAREELAAVDARMAELKVKLYARLGRANINLEE